MTFVVKKLNQAKSIAGCLGWRKSFKCTSHIGITLARFRVKVFQGSPDKYVTCKGRNTNVYCIEELF